MVVDPNQIIEVQQAGPAIPYLVSMAISAAVSYGIMLLTKKKPPATPLDDTNVDPSIRGSRCPYVLGRRKSSPIVGWVGNYTVMHDIFHGHCMHILSIGQGKELVAIYERGKKIYYPTDPLTPTTHPSGTVVTPNPGYSAEQFIIYWGETTQPVDSTLSSFTGLSSNYQGVMYIVWKNRRLGSSKMWPMMEYEFTVEPQFDTLFSKDVWMDSILSTTDGTLTPRYGYFRVGDRPLDVRVGYFLSSPTSAEADKYSVGDIVILKKGVTEFRTRITSKAICYSPVTGRTHDLDTELDYPTSWVNHGDYGDDITGSIVEEEAKGINPIAMLYQYLFSPFPYGMEYDTLDYNLTDMETIFDIFDDSGDIPLPSSLTIRDKRSIQDAISMILQDCGIMMAWDVVTAQYRFNVMMPTDTATNISSEYVLHSEDSYEEAGYSTLETQQRVFVFTDANRKYEQSSIMLSDDGDCKYAKYPNSKQVALNLTTDMEASARLAARRDKEYYVREGLKLTLSCEKYDLLPGDLYTIDGVSGAFRLTNKEHTKTAAKFKATFLGDAFSDYSGDVSTEKVLFDYSNLSTAYADTHFTIIEANKFFAPGQEGVYLLRIRGTKNGDGTSLYVSTDNSSYYATHTTSGFGSGGKLTSALTADYSTTGGSVPDAVVTTGPTFVAVGPDIDIIEDLSGDTNAWEAGEQYAIINGELFYLQNVEATANDNEYTLKGLIRARESTSRESHTIDDVVYVGKTADLELLYDRLMLPGETLYAKSIPYTLTGTVDISDVTPVSITYQPDGLRLLPGGGAGELPSDENLEAHLAFDDDSATIIRDLTGNGHSGTITGSPTFADGPSGKAITFGSGDSMTIDDS